MTTKPLRATDLTRRQILAQEMRQRAYQKQFAKCMDSISHCIQNTTRTFTDFEIRPFLLGEPYYNQKECAAYVGRELANKEFYVRPMDDGNRFYISWQVTDVEHVRAKIAERDRKMTDSNPTPRQYKVNPNDPISRAHFTANLIKEKQKAHQKSEAVRVPGKRSAKHRTVKKVK